MKRTINRALAVAVILLVGSIMLIGKAETTHAARFVYTDRTAFLNDLAAFGYQPVQESFEDDAAWGSVRTTIPGGQITAPSITNKGLTWTANNDNSEVTTGQGPAYQGEWGFFTLPHGDPVNGITDGWVVTGSQTLYAAGGFVETNTPYAALGLIVDGDEQNPVDFENDVLTTQHKFFGVIDTSGFNSVEFRELEAAGDDWKLIFGDAFTFGILPSVEAPLVRFSLRSGVLVSGDLASLQASEDDYLTINAELDGSGTNYVTTTLVSARSPEPDISKLDLTLELSGSSGEVRTAVKLRNFDTGRWDTLGVFRLPQVDTTKDFLDVASPDSYVGAGGRIQGQVITIASPERLPDGYTVQFDEVHMEIAP